MPIYEYHCPRCEEQFELLIRGQHQRPECPRCGNADLQRLPSVPAAHTRSSLPLCPPSPGGCGLPECGQGRCQWET